MRRLLLLILPALCTVGAMSQNLTRRTPGGRSAAVKARTAEEPAQDTLRGVWCDSVAVAGFEKPLRAVRETMFVTNRSSRRIDGVGLEITYTDMRGKMLHKAVHSLACEVPAGETRRVEVPSFDRSGLLYYHLSPVPQRAQRATPFDVQVRVLYLLAE